VSQKATVNNGVLDNSLNNLDSKLYSKQQITENTFLANQKSIANVLNKYVFNKFFICCKESRIESPTSFYGCFYIGPFDDTLSQTLAHNIRRTLLSQLSGFAITAVEIDGVLHKFSNLPGIKENVLDILCNLQNLVLKENIKPQFAKALKNNHAITLQKLEFTGYLRVRGPGIVTAADILLPSGLQCVNPNQYIATLAEDGILNIKFYISAGQGQNYIKQKQKNTDLEDLKQQFLINQFPDNISSDREAKQPQDLFTGLNKASADLFDSSQEGINSKVACFASLRDKNKIYLDSVFMPVTKVNTFVQQNDKCTDDYLENNLQFRFLPVELQQSLNFDGVSKPLGFNEKVNTKALIQTSNQTSIYSKQNTQTVTPLKLLKTQSTNFDTIYKTSNFNLNSQENAFSDFKCYTASGIATVKNIQTFFKCVPTSDNMSTSSTTIELNKTQVLTNDLNLNQVLEEGMSEELLQQVIVLTEKNKVGFHNSLNFKKQSHIVVEIWTNGSIHPREALKNCLQFLSTTFVSLENVKMLGAMFKSDVTYTKVLNNYKY
jgi:DNA-directed RNA polymerase alpha subunit